MIFPPLWRFIDYPHAAVPVLSGFLRKKGLKVLAIDSNLELQTALCDNSFLGKYLAELQRRNLNSRGKEIKKVVFEPSISLSEKVQKVIKEVALLKGLPDIMEDKTNAPYEFLSGKFMSSIDHILENVENPRNNFFLWFLKRKASEICGISGIRIVGISIAGTVQFVPALTLASNIKLLNPDIHIVAGGSWCTLKQSFILQEPRLFDYFDSFVIGEGETPLYCLYKYLQGEIEINDVSNLIYRKPDGCPHATQMGRYENIELLPTPSFNNLPLSSYGRGHVYVFPLEASRGCPWNKCTFCDYTKLFPLYRSKSVRKIVQEIKEIKTRHKTKHIVFVDNSTSFNLLDSLCNELLHQKLDITWSTSTRVSRRFTSDFCQRLAESGCIKLFFGVESGCARVLRQMNKGITKDICLTTLSNCHKAKIEVEGSVIIGFTSETQAEREETLELVHKLPFVKWSFNNFQLPISSILYQQLKRQEILLPTGNNTIFTYIPEYSVSFQEVQKYTKKWKNL